MWPSKIFDTEVYNNLRCIQYVIKDYDKLKKYVKILFGINEQEYLNILKKAEKRILRGIARVLVKHMNNETNNLGNQMTTIRIKGRSRTELYSKGNFNEKI